MNRQDALAYVERWRLVRERQREESRLMTVEEKFRRLALLMRTLRHLPDPRRADEDEEVRIRWGRLREALLG